MKMGPYVSPMMFTGPKKQKNPPEKAEKHLRMAENGENSTKKPKKQKNAKTQKRPNKSSCKFQ